MPDNDTTKQNTSSNTSSTGSTGSTDNTNIKPRDPNNKFGDSQKSYHKPKHYSESGKENTYGNKRFRHSRRITNVKNLNIDYKDPQVLNNFTSKTGKILSRRVTGVGASVQRKVAAEIKRARHVGLLPYSNR